MATVQTLPRDGWANAVVTQKKDEWSVKAGADTLRIRVWPDSSLAARLAVSTTADALVIGATASFTMTAFNKGGGRMTRIFGTRGTIESDDSSVIRVYDFLTRKTETIDTKASGADMDGGHGGGDGGLLRAFCRAIVEGRPELIVSGTDATIESHLTTFAAEKARRTGRVVEMGKAP